MNSVACSMFWQTVVAIFRDVLLEVYIYIEYQHNLIYKEKMLSFN